MFERCEFFKFRGMREFLRTGLLRTGWLRRRLFVCVIAATVLGAGSAIADVYLPNLFPFLDFAGFSGTYSKNGDVDLSGPLFQTLGTKGGSCVTFHQPGNAFGLSAANAQLRYLVTRGKGPLFAQVDGSTCPS